MDQHKPSLTPCLLAVPGAAPHAHRTLPAPSPFAHQLPPTIHKMKSCPRVSHNLSSYKNTYLVEKNFIFSFPFSLKSEEFPPDPSEMNRKESFSPVHLNDAYLRGWKITEKL